MNSNLQKKKNKIFVENKKRIMHPNDTRRKVEVFSDRRNDGFVDGCQRDAATVPV